jgi:EpsI family protein
MTKHDKPNRRRVTVAALAASLLMLVFGVGYRVLAGRLTAPANTTPISLDALQGLPQQIGDWTGQDVALDAAVVRATDTDAHLNRRYSRYGSLESISFYLACGVRARDLMPHRPEVCYTGNGYTLTARRSVDLALRDGTKLPCNVMEFSRGALSTEKVMVLDYYIVDGQYCRDVSLLRSKAWRGSSTVDYVAQAQIATPITATRAADSAEKIVSDFAVASASSIAQLFENGAKRQSSEKNTIHDNHMLGGTKGG